MSWCQGGSVQTRFTVHVENGYKITSTQQDKCKKNKQKGMIQMLLTKKNKNYSETSQWGHYFQNKFPTRTEYENVIKCSLLTTKIGEKVCV